MRSEALQRALEQNRPKLVTLDLSEVTFIDCRGLHALLSAQELCRDGRHSLRLVRCETVRRFANLCCIHACSN